MKKFGKKILEFLDHLGSGLMCAVTQTRLFEIKMESTLKVEEKEKETVGGTPQHPKEFFCVFKRLSSINGRHHLSFFSSQFKRKNEVTVRLGMCPYTQTCFLFLLRFSWKLLFVLI
jgi:hypothetical protein